MEHPQDGGRDQEEAALSLLLPRVTSSLLCKIELGTWRNLDYNH